MGNMMIHTQHIPNLYASQRHVLGIGTQAFDDGGISSNRKNNTNNKRKHAEHVDERDDDEDDDVDDEDDDDEEEEEVGVQRRKRPNIGIRGMVKDVLTAAQIAEIEMGDVDSTDPEIVHSVPLGTRFVIHPLVVNEWPKYDPRTNKYYNQPHIAIGPCPQPCRIATVIGDKHVQRRDWFLAWAATIKAKLERPHYMDILRESMDTIFENPSSIFTTMTAMDFIYKGYEVNCKQNSTSARVACAELRRSKTLKSMNAERTQLRFRWFDALNNSIQARYTVLRGAKNIHDIGRLIAVNDKPTLKVFKEDPKCNIFNGTDKIFYPPLQKKRDIIWVYAHDACKSFPLRYQYKKTMRGVTTAWKSLNTSDPLMSPTCECDRYIGCSLRGTLDMYPCADVFVLASSPHFYLTEPSILNTLDGMNPIEHLHKGGIYFDLLTGIPILSIERVQVSWLVKRIPEYPIFNSIAGDLWIPLFWYEETFSIETSDLVLINAGRISKIMGVATGYIMIIVGVIGFIALALRFHYHTSVTPHEVAEIQQAN